MHNAVADAFRNNYKRWTTVERMRILLAWTLQLRASMTQQPDSIWIAAPLNQSVEVIDLPYKEIAAELADPDAILRQNQKKQKETQEEQTNKTKSESKMAEADAAVMAALGLSAEDL
jgi:hypothetical protein